MTNSFVLGNADFPPLYTVSKLHSASISKNVAPEDKPACQLIRNTCNSELVPIKRHTVNHVLHQSFLPRDPISVV